MLARSLPAALFFLPALRQLRRRYVAGRELAADRRAIAAVGTAPLASALYRVAGGPSWSELGAAAAIGGKDALDARVAQLESGTEPPIPSVSRRGVALSVAGAGVLLWSVVASFVALGPAMASFCTGR